MSEKINPEVCDPSPGCCSPKELTPAAIEGSIVRRDFLKALGILSGGLLLDFPAFGNNKIKSTYTIPTDKDYLHPGMKVYIKEVNQKYIPEKNWLI